MKGPAGFTLIELLVVIAIIGILSSVVLASLNTARDKGANSAIKANLANLRPQAELYYDTTGNSSYGSVGVSGVSGNCLTTVQPLFADTKIGSFIQAAVSSGGTNQTCIAQPAGGPATSYVTYITLKVNEVVGAITYDRWCVDSNGNSIGLAVGTVVSATATVCP